MPYNIKNNFSLNRVNVIDRWTVSELVTAFDRTYTPGSKTSVFYHKDIFYFTQRIQPPKLLPLRFKAEARGLLFTPQHFLFEIFDRKLQQYVEADLINFNSRLFDEKSSAKQFKRFEDPFAVLTLGELEAGFVVCMIPLVFCILVFLAEWVPAAIDLIVFLVIFKKFFNVLKIEQSANCEAMKVKVAFLQAKNEKENQKIKNVHALP